MKANVKANMLKVVGAVRKRIEYLEGVLLDEDVSDDDEDVSFKNPF